MTLNKCYEGRPIHTHLKKWYLIIIIIFLISNPYVKNQYDSLITSGDFADKSILQFHWLKNQKK